MINKVIKKIKSFFKKLHYIVIVGYNPYPLYFFDLLTGRKIKYRTGDCIDCIECCKYNCDCIHSGECFCKHVDLKNKRCTIYNNRKCNIWFPVSQKEIDYFKTIKKNFKCKYGFKK